MKGRQHRSQGIAKSPPSARRTSEEISRDLEDMIHSIDGAAALGEVEDAEDRELLMASLRQAMVLSKRIAKKKFTPKKYRNES